VDDRARRAAPGVWFLARKLHVQCVVVMRVERGQFGVGTHRGVKRGRSILKREHDDHHHTCGDSHHNFSYDNKLTSMHTSSTNLSCAAVTQVTDETMKNDLQIVCFEKASFFVSVFDALCERH
jgi:hypothetical protein